MEICSLVSPSYWGFKFNVDGALRGNLGPSGIGEVLLNNKSGVLVLIFKFVGICDSSEAEVLAIL